jgi:hypothetical protein
MSNRTWLGTIACVALLGACGGNGNNTIDTSMGTFSCDFKDPQSGDPICRENSWSGGAYSTADWVQGCIDHQGTSGQSCNRDKALGGCQGTANVDGIFLTDTYWFYNGRLVTLMASCPTGTSWVNPK